VRTPRRRVRGLRLVRRLPSSGVGFLVLERHIARNVYRGGALSRPYRFEVLHRRGIDAVAIIPFYFTPRTGRLTIVIKIGFRPGLYQRSRLRLPVRDHRSYTSVRESVAGSLEPEDLGESGVDRRAIAELLEETGLRPRHRRVLRLGAGFFPSHGQSTEKVHLRACEIDPTSAVPPSTDGSVNEADSGTEVYEAGRILRMCRSGSIEDPKIEIGVTRLCLRLGYSLQGHARRRDRRTID
jgi:8-oxo-dGTP pyrophosphatase MutT (NUDIX family)